jgi:SPP1 gp7 family putative phage head morphogenesis protein
MTWTVTADVGEFAEAVDWFLARAVVTKGEALRLDDDARQRAFWIGAGLQLDQVQSVFDEIGKALKNGEPFEEWRKRVRGVLQNDAHALTVFRNATQRAYSAGRWRQMHDPDVLAARPFGMFDAVLDSRSSEICPPLDGTILPLDHEFFKTHVPPLHHRCRSGIRSLRKSDAEQRGITTVPPIVDKPDGFGLAPDAQPVWKPDPRKHDPALIRELDKKSRKPRAKKAKAAPRIHDPKFWEAELEGQYGEAAPAVAWGRAMFERGLDRSAIEVATELERLKAAGVPGLAKERFDAMKALGNQPLRNTTFANTADGKAFVALAEHSLTIKRGGFEVLRAAGTGFDYPATRDAAKFYGELLDRSVARPSGWTLEVDRGARAYASPAARKIVLSDIRAAETAVHELAHAIEFSDARALARSRAFLKARAGNAQPKKLRELTGFAYGDQEVAWEDKFINPYVGKDYGDRATEITSVGYEQMASPFGLGGLAGKDLDMLHFLLGQLAGR